MWLTNIGQTLYLLSKAKVVRCLAGACTGVGVVVGHGLLSSMLNL
ncbi:hypothetical protein Hanom_Chr02g00127261 [Helianthus anomalus]